MRKHSNFIALLLSVLMVASQFSVTTFAAAEAVADTQATAVEQSAEADQDQESSETESVTETPAAPEKVEVPEKEAAPKAEAEKAEAPKEEAPEEVAFDQSKTVDGVKVTVKADKGVFPADAKLSVKKVSVPKSVDTEDAVKAYAFDISILVDGEEVQPDGKAEVSFKTDEVKKYDTTVYHMDGKKAEELDVTEKGKTATVETGSFSTYVVTFYVDREVYRSDAVSDGQKVAKPTPDPKSDGAAFDYWAVNSGGTPTEYNFNTPVSSEMSLNASWTTDFWTVTFDPAGGVFENPSDGTLKVAKNKKAVVPPDPKKNGYEFQGWYEYDEADDQTSASQFDFSFTKITKDTTLKAKWKGHTWKVTVSDSSDTATIKCEDADCEYNTKPITVSISANDSVYDGKSKTATVSGEIPDELKEKFVVAYESDGVDKYVISKDGDAETWKPNSGPTEVGTYTATTNIFIDGEKKGTISKTFKITPASVIITPPKANDGLVYNGGEQELATAGSAKSSDSVAVIKYAVTTNETKPDTSDYKESIDKKKDAGNYYVWYQVFDKSDGVFSNSNYELQDNNGDPIYSDSLPKSVTVEIKKADPIEKEPEGLTLPFTGSDQVLVKGGALKDFAISDGLKIYYSKSIDSGYSENLPAEAAVQTYTFYWEVLPDDNPNYNKASGTIRAQIHDEKITPPVPASGLTYNDSEQNLIESDAVLSDLLVEKGAKTVYAVTKSDEDVPGDSDYDAIETAVGTEAGEYYIWYKAVSSDGTETYTEPAYVVTEIGKADAVIKWYKDESSTSPLASDSIPEYVYNGEAQGPVAKAFTPEDPGTELEIDFYIDGYEREVGDNYEATVTGSNSMDNYKLPDEAVQSFKIVPKEVTIKWFENASSTTPLDSGAVPEYVYNGKEQAPVAKAFDGDTEVEGLEVTVSGKGTNAAETEYTAKASITDKNYKITNDPATQNFKINKKPVTITGLDAKNKEYDGTTSAGITVGGTHVIGKVSGDEAEVVSAVGEFEDKDAGNNKNVKITSVELTGAAADNYIVKTDGTAEKEVSSDNPIIVKANITRATATIVWSDETTFTYDGQNHAPTATATGVNGETLGVEVTGAKKDAGTYNAEAVKLQDDTGLAKNYTMPANDVKKSFTINPKEISFSVNPETKVYNGENQAPEVVISDAVAGDKVIPVYTIKDSKGTEVANEKGAKTGPKDAGTYTVTLTGIYEQGVINSKESTNYKLPENCVKNYTITKADLTLTPKDFNKIYGDEAKGEGYTAAVLMNPDKDGDAPKSGVIEGTPKYSITGSSGTGSGGVYKPGDDVGDYAVKITNITNDSSGLHAKNYNLKAGSDGKMVLEARPITFKWSTPDSFTYDGKEHEVTAEIENIFSGDKDKPAQLDIKYTDNANTDAGSYKAVAELKGTKAKNYVIKGSTQEKEWTIDKAKVTVTANSATINYGDAFTPSGKVTPSDVSSKIGTIKYECSYRKNDKQGTYPITVKLENADPNYEVTLKGGTLTVKEKNTALVAKAATKGSKKAKISWTAVTGAAKYEIYFAKCNAGGKDHSLKKIKTVKAGKLSFTKKKLKKGQCYKFCVVAKDASGKVISKSLTSHFIAGKYNKKYTNAKSLKLTSAKSVTIYKGTAASVTAKPKKAKSKRKFLTEDHADLLRYTSSNKAVATVDENGTINGVGTGYCKVFVQTVNGIWQTVEVTVK